MDLITDIRISPKKPRPGQPVNIKVLGENGKLLDDSKFHVHINNIPKSSATTQFTNEGEHNVVITVVHDKDKERKTVTIPVAGTPLTLITGAGKTLAILRAAGIPHDPYRIEFAIGARSSAKVPVGFGHHGVGNIFTSNVLRKRSDNKKVVSKHDWLGATNETRPASQYLWNFGDGTTETTNALTIEHDYRSSITATKAALVFTVTCTPLLRNGSKHPIGTLTRTLLLHSAYAIARRRGFIQPPTRFREVFLRDEGSYVAAIKAHNIESEVLEITHRAVTPLGTDPAATYPISMELLRQPILIGPGADHTFRLNVPTRSVPKGTATVELRFAGASKSGKPVRIAAVIELPAKDQPWVNSGNVISKIDVVGDVGGSVVLALEIDDRCDPENISSEEAVDAQRDGLACQLTDEEETAQSPARFVNACKGDIILSPGGSGLIGQLLGQISPPQIYSHCGIMTRNFDEISHSSGSQERLMDQKAGPWLGLPGFKEEALRWIWPGPINQSVNGAINGQTWTDPEGEEYTMSSFSERVIGRDDPFDEFTVAHAMVVKPDPMLESAAVRARLHAVADEARRSSARAGEAAFGHYSFYPYTDARVGLDQRAPDSAGWAAGTFPSMCSSFIWLMAHREGVRFESPEIVARPEDLEPADIDPVVGAEVSAETLDGLYHYTEEERQIAGAWLFGKVKDKMNRYGLEVHSFKLSTQSRPVVISQ